MTHYPYYNFPHEPSYSDDDIDVRIGKNLRRLRLKAGYNKQDIADIFHIPLNHVIEYELGERTVPAIQLFALHHFFGCDYTEFFSYQVFGH